jgi:uncharacterized protein YndB with AHSA1/START domain
MTSIVAVTRIIGPAGPVFDLITSARFWPQWHPATLSVSGVTQRPYRLGDVIHERVRFAGTETSVSWRVAEHERPSHVVLQALTAPARITYSLEPKGDATVFSRELEYDAPSLRQATQEIANLDTLMQQQSEEGVRRLKELVERILRDEQVAGASVAEG